MFVSLALYTHLCVAVPPRAFTRDYLELLLGLNSIQTSNIYGLIALASVSKLSFYAANGIVGPQGRSTCLSDTRTGPYYDKLCGASRVYSLFHSSCLQL